MIPSEVAVLLPIHVRKIYRLAEERAIPGCRVGRSWRFNKADFLKVLSKMLNEVLYGLPQVRIRPQGDVTGKLTAIVGVAHGLTGGSRVQEEMVRSNEQLGRFNCLAGGRELRMVDLKKQVNELSQALGKSSPYDLAFLQESSTGGAREQE